VQIFVMSVGLSLCLSSLKLGSNWTDFHENLYLRIFSKPFFVFKKNTSLIKICEEEPVIYTKTYLYLQQNLSEFLLEWEVFQTKIVEKNQTHFLCSKFFSENCAVYEIMWKNNVQPDRPKDDNMAHAHCMLDN
jgi:hypothetical protein